MKMRALQSRERNILQAIIPMAKSLRPSWRADHRRGRGDSGSVGLVLKKVTFGCDFVQG